MISLHGEQDYFMKKYTFSFDIGYASIGWSVVSVDDAVTTGPVVEGTGVVLFPSDDCLASARRTNRRMRRTIRSRRVRIARIGAILEHYGVITPQERKLPGLGMPFHLAARAIRGLHKLTGVELWHVLRWYAHNRGYDGNSQWRCTPDNNDADEDIAKVEAAKAKMAELGTSTMAETVSLILGTDPSNPVACLGQVSYKSLNIAFPRDVVEREVRKLVENSGVCQEIVELILGSACEHRDALAACGVRFPLRYFGSVLFGQLIPRFDNRIIARCPITWAETYQAALSAGDNEQQARKSAEKYAKVPKADCSEFYEYRFARILSNIRVEGDPINADTRLILMEEARQNGKFTKGAFIKRVESLVGSKNHNLRNYFQIVPDSEKSLIVVPSSDKERASGRAPYARPVLRRVVQECLRGEDSTRPAFSLSHPDGEKKAIDGVLYCLQNPESMVCKLQALRPIDQQTNNHLVRHRMLIFDRLLSDMITHYTGDKASAVARCCVEVGRELKSFSGMTAKQIQIELNERLRHFKKAEKMLKEHENELASMHVSITAGLIRKCRIAMDLNWKCPYTGKEYGLLDLPHLDRDHIIPFASRQTNALSALVLTWPEVNKMKGKRTGVEFVREFAGKQVEGKENLSIMTEKRYLDFVKKLDVKGAPDDQARKKKRKSLLLVEDMPKKGEPSSLGFTEGQLTQSSQLMKIAVQVAKKRLKNAVVSAIPGRITAEVRKSWDLTGSLVDACPDVVDPVTNKLRDKDAIRNITHLHHALDACVLALIPHLVPAGTNGLIWQALVQRHLNEATVEKLRKLPESCHFLIDTRHGIALRDVPEHVRLSVASGLLEKRIVTHVPADMSGARFDQNYKRILSVEGDSVTIDVDGKTKNVSISSVVGALPCSKLSHIKAALKVSKNYAVALDPSIEVIPHLQVYKKLCHLKRLNDGKPVRLLKKGQLIRVFNHKTPSRNRIWRVSSIKSNSKGPALDLQIPESAESSSKTCAANWINVELKSLMKIGLAILSTSYIGFSE